MFYELIRNKRDQWYASPDCTARSIVQYIIGQGQMRDAQLDAIKTYLFLKIACDNRPLWQLFCRGTFNADYSGFDFDGELFGEGAREELKKNGGAMALFQYSRLKDKNGRQLGPNLEQFVRSHAATMDVEDAFKKIFYGVNYTDYLFSLPMGAGKTYLMAAFIYLDLYLAQNEPDNPAFAHNFIILAPSGLKSSIVPSLRNIREFDPTWVIPKHSADAIRRLINFEILDEQKSAARSNRIKNPNAQKINSLGIPEYQYGTIAITNAEKVILDRADKNDTPPTLFTTPEEKREWQRIMLANELRDIIGRLPNLAIYIDEVHHASDGDIKLRKVVNGWAGKGSFNSVLGFSGTPYLEKAEPVTFGHELSIKNTDLSNVVYYYPLNKGTGNFLKVPDVIYADEDTETIVTQGVTDFLKMFGDKRYANGTMAKQAIYCGKIETLEDVVYPLVCNLLSAYGINPSLAVLKYHDGNKQYKKPDGCEAAFSALDTPLSEIRVILLVQIGKEGWDCKSLTSVILPQKGVCPQNMVLQTSCRCLRQVVRGNREEALIWMNKGNADILQKQLMQQQNITLEDFTRTPDADSKNVKRFSRQHVMKVPPISYYQLRVEFEDFITEPADTARALKAIAAHPAELDFTLVYTGDFERLGAGMQQIRNDDETESLTYRQWLYRIAAEGFGTMTMSELREYDDELMHIYNKIARGGMTLPQYDHQRIRSQVRQAFLPRRDYKTRQHEDLSKAQLLLVENLRDGTDDGRYHPDQTEVQAIVSIDKNGLPPVPPEMLAYIEQMRKMGITIPTPISYNERRQTYHYLPYHFDSTFEIDYFKDLLKLIADKKLEAYFNGDDTVTQFRIRCYRHTGSHWAYIGNYVPDFVVLSRNTHGDIDRVMIVETKGKGFAAKFSDRRQFMETKFLEMNSNFRFLYIEDTLNETERNSKTLKAIDKFFKL